MTRQRFPKIQAVILALAALTLGSSGLWIGASAAGPALPVPCAAGACGKTGPSKWVTQGSATAVATQNALTINQTTNSAILNWSSFNIGVGGSVAFKQPGSSSIALNRIFQASPSQIFGNLQANGQVYLINLNGFLFGPKSTVNVGGLLVSSLPMNLTDANFGNGILSPLQNGSGDPATFDATCVGTPGCVGDPLAPGGRTVVLDANGNQVLDATGKPIPLQGVVVQPGAQLTAADQGRLLLVGQNVTNGGTLTAPDGQVVLAAGTKVFLQADSDPSLRGLVVEVDGNGTAANQLTGLLSAPRGNITMVGLAVNQDGRISATTSVSANGSIRLEAAGGATPGGGSIGNVTVASTQGGTLTIGPQSEMDILPELTSSATAVPAQTQLSSSVTLLGEQVILQGGSIIAPGGNLIAIAAANPSPAAANPAGGVSGTADPNARLRIDTGTTIDLSGSEASLPVTANLVAVQLRSSELADDPTQRNGPLHGLTVYVDARNPPPAALANVSGEVAGVTQSIAQRTENGGHAVFQSEGDVVFASGASLNVSGGATTYAGGVFQTSYLVGANGQLYPIATANPLLTYVGVLNPTFSQTYNKWGVKDVLPTPGLSAYQPGYVQGAPAGSVQFVAPTMVLQGSLQGSAVSGLYQRTPSAAVPGGQLIIGLPGGTALSQGTQTIDYLSPAVSLTTAPYPITVADNASLPGPLTLDLPVSYLTSSGFTSTQIFSNSGVTFPAGTPLVLPSGSTLSVDAARVDILSGITDPAGTLSFQNVSNVGSASATANRPGVYVADGVTLDVRGQWTNDALSPGTVALAQTWQNGGSINLGIASTGALLSVGNDVNLRASGGAWLNVKGALTSGTGGSIALDANSVGGGLDVGANLSIGAFGVNGAAGGTFSLTAPRIEVSAGNGGWTMPQQADDASTVPGAVFQVHSNLFSDYGFQNINLTASGLVVPSAATTNVLTVDAGTAIDATVRSLVLDPNPSTRASAATLDGIAAVTTLAPYLRPAANVTLNALPPYFGTPSEPLGATTIGDVMIGTGASVATDAGGSISLASLDSILVNGTLRAPGGTITLHVLSPLDSPDGNSNHAYGSLYDSGFLPNQRIELGATGAVDVSGAYVSQPSSTGAILGTVSSGGTVNLFADRGAVVTDAGSLISAAGVTAALDVLQANGTYRHEIASTAGGSINVQSGESISLRGAIEAAAGSGGTTGPAAGGSLNVELTRSEPWWGAASGTNTSNSFNNSGLTIDLMATVPSSVPVSLADSNQAWIGAAQLSQSGLDAVRLEAGNTVEMSGNFSLALNRQLVIDSPVVAANVGAHASLTAPYLEVGYDLLNPSSSTNSNTPTAGTGSLSFSGSEIDLVGTTVFQGASDVRFVSAGDLLLRGQPTGTGAGTLQGSLSLYGNLTLDAARIYPATATNFAITALEDPATGIPGTVTIGQTGVNPGTPLSAGSALSINAFTVQSTGTLYAPFGTISLNATGGLTLGDGSLTSVSGGGLTIPYGETQFGGQQWIYSVLGSSALDAITVNGVPTRAVNLTAPAITIGKQATIDLSGGGDLSAFEWVPGPGGSKDALAPTPGLYAIVPSTLGQAAPQDPQNSVGSTITSSESVYLSGGGGLAAGTYPLLPARYALLPGAFLIQVEPQLRSNSPGSLGKLADGTPVVAGFLSYGSTGLHQSPGYEGFAIYPGTYGSQLAAYNVTLASKFFSAAASAAGLPRPTLPADAGSLTISVGNALDAAGNVLTAAASGGLAAPIAISANDLFVGTSTDPVPSGAVSILASVLEGWQPGSLLLGGTFTDAKTIDVAANSVTLGTGTTLTAGQIVLVAGQSIDVQSGATVQSTSAMTGTAPTALPLEQSITLSGVGGTNAGFLAVSDRNWLTPLRTASASSAGAATVAIDTGASIASRGSLSIDGIGGVTLAGSLTGPGAEWSLGSSSIAFVPTGMQADSLSIDPRLVVQLGTANAVRLASTGSIDLLTPVTLGVSEIGSPTLRSLTLVASSLNNLNTTGSTAGAPTRFGAQTLVLEGSGASASPGVAGPAGTTLSLTAGEMDITGEFNMGPNALAINGFAATHANVAGAVVGQGTGALSVGGAFTIAAAGVTAAAAADTEIGATGVLSVTPSAGSTGKVPLLQGGALTLSGASIDIAGNSGGPIIVAAPAGMVTLDSTGDLNIGAGAIISTAGNLVSIGNQTAGTPGGSLAINAGGNLILSPNATLDVSGAGTAAAGTLSLTASGSASIGAILSGSAGAGGGGGSFSLDAGSLTAVSGAAGANPLTSVAAELGAGGFTDAIDLRVRTGDLNLVAGSKLAANAVTLTADTGNVDVGGQIVADAGSLHGTVSLFGGAGVELKGTAAVSAQGTDSSGHGGTIEIGAGQLVADSTGMLSAYNGGSIILDAGSTISTPGSGGTGTLLLRAPAVGSDVGINLTNNTPLSGLNLSVGQVIVEPVLPFNTANFSNPTAPTATDFNNVYGAVSTYMIAAGSNIAGRLAPSGGVPLMVEAGVEIIAQDPTTTLTLKSSGRAGTPALDLSNWRFNGAPVDLTIRAAGDIVVASTITDGFGKTAGSSSQPILLSGPSSSIRLVAGADLSSADPLAVTPVNSNGTGSLTIGTPGGAVAVVRTGTGDLDLIAAKDIILGGQGDGAYTAGVPAIGTGSSPYSASAYLTPQSATDPATGAAYDYAALIPGTKLLMSFPTNGGDLVVSAGEDINNLTQTSPGGVTNWQLREGGGPKDNPAVWGVNLTAYDWSFGTLGGGDLRISAGRDALNVSAAAADSLLPQQGGAAHYVTGGGLSFTAGRDIGSAQVFLADGTGSVTAGGALSAVLPSANAATGDPNVGSAFYLQASSLDVWARLGLAVDGVFNPTALAVPHPSNANLQLGSFLSYGDTSALNLGTTTGDVDLGAASAASATLLGLALNNAQGGSALHGNDVFPASLSVEALGGNIAFGTGIGIGGTVALDPSPNGQLDLLAAQNITQSALGIVGSIGRLVMSDAAPGSYATVASPGGTNAVDSLKFSGNIHASDTTPALVTAGGSIDELTLYLPKAAQVVAGQDIVDLTYTGQNLNASDQTVLSAGRDFVYSNSYTGSGVSLGGPGALEILAGRNITLGFSNGVVTTGNLLNANLPTAQGADLTMVTGMGTNPDFADFLTKIIAPSTTYQAELVNYVESLQGSSGLSFAAAETAFEALTPERQQPLIDAVFYNELLLSGRAANTVPGVGFTEGYAAIDALFPHSRTGTPGAVADAYAGNLTLDFSRIYTLSGGNINLVVPGGQIDVGLANPPASLSTTKSASQLGIVTDGPGNVNIYSKGDVNVNSSRIFTLGGGNILIWSDEGSIDAGLGAKSAVSAPPPSILIGSDGTVTLNFSGAAVGSGIRTIQTDPNVAQGNVDLIAPVGTVNAGDAGIGAAGNINIAALSVIGVSNISFGGTATGVPAQVSNIGASLSGASSAASGASNASTSAVANNAAEKEAAAPLAQTALSWLDVFVTGLGEENCKPDDIECLKRQKTPTR